MLSLNLLSQAEEQARLSIVSIDPGTILFTLINTLIICFIYLRFLQKPVLKILDKRMALTNDSLEAANAAKERAQSHEQERLDELLKTKTESQEIVAKAVRRAKEREEEIISEATKKAMLIRMKAEENISQEKIAAMKEIRKQISELVIITAQAVAEKEIREEDNKTIINSFLVKVGSDD